LVISQTLPAALGVETGRPDEGLHQIIKVHRLLKSPTRRVSTRRVIRDRTR
jgi:hypothetical protein